MFRYIVIILLLNNFVVYSQDIDYAKKTINTLCSNEFHGRGYTHNGVKKSAKFIFNELNKNSNSNSNICYQKFTMPVSVISKFKYFKIDSVNLTCGKDFLIYPNSASCKGKYEIININKNNIDKLLTESFYEHFIALDTSISNNKKNKDIVQSIIKNNALHAKGIINLTTGNLMQTQANEPIKWVNSEVKISLLPNNNAKYINLNYKSKFIKNYKTSNIYAFIKGKSDSVIVFTTHYDHLGELGDAVYYGANDNASGTAMVLDLYKTFCKTTPKYSLAFIFFTGEEVGLIGSQYFVEHPLLQLSSIKFLINLDIMGSGEDGITVVNSTIFKNEFELLNTINNENKYLTKIKSRGVSNNSDHAPFYAAGIKSFFIYSQGKTGPYHNPEDTPLNLSLGKYTEIAKLLIDFVNKM